MILIEQDAKRLLMERLDECLKVHADMLDAQNIGSIYELQGFSELHYYLKVEHLRGLLRFLKLLRCFDPCAAYLYQPAGQYAGFYQKH